MPVEQREAGRWKRERQKSGTNTVGSAREGSTRWRDSRPMGMDGTGRLDGTHVGILDRGWLVLLKTGACCGLPIFFEVTTNWRAGCQKLACPVRREGRPESSSLPLSRHARVHRLSRGALGTGQKDVSESSSFCSVLST